MTLESYAVRWLARVRAQRKPRTAETYAAICRDHLFPALGAIPLTALRRAMVRDLLTGKLNAGYARGSVRLMLATLRACLNAARFEDEFLPANPADRWGQLLPRPRGPALDRSLPPRAVRSLLAFARAHHAELGALFTVGYHTGLRLGELLALEWTDVDLEERLLLVRRAIDWRRRAGTPKGGVGRVPLNRAALLALAELRETAGGCPVVFHSPSGRAWSRVHVWRVLDRCCRAAGLPHASVHQLRHSFVTHLAASGVDAWRIRDLARHASIATTELYVHSHRLHRGAVGRLDGRMRGR